MKNLTKEDILTYGTKDELIKLKEAMDWTPEEKENFAKIAKDSRKAYPTDVETIKDKMKQFLKAARGLGKEQELKRSSSWHKLLYYVKTGDAQGNSNEDFEKMLYNIRWYFKGEIEDRASKRGYKPQDVSDLE